MQSQFMWGSSISGLPDAMQQVKPYSTSVRGLTAMLLLDAICELSLLALVRRRASHQCVTLSLYNRCKRLHVNISLQYKFAKHCNGGSVQTTSISKGPSSVPAVKPALQIKPRFNTEVECEYVYVSRMSLSHQTPQQSQAFLRIEASLDHVLILDFEASPIHLYPYFASKLLCVGLLCGLPARQPCLQMTPPYRSPLTPLTLHIEAP